MELRSGNNYNQPSPPTAIPANPPAGGQTAEDSGASSPGTAGRAGRAANEQFSSIPSRRGHSPDAPSSADPSHQSDERRTRRRLAPPESSGSTQASTGTNHPVDSGYPRHLYGLPAEMHAYIAAHLGPGSTASMALTNRHLYALYQPHVIWSALREHVTEKANGYSPLFERFNDADPLNWHTDEVIAQRLRKLLDVPPHEGPDPAPATIGNMLPVEDKATTLIRVLWQAHLQPDGLRQLAFDLSLPHVKDLPEHLRNRVIPAVVERADGGSIGMNINAPDARWCLGLWEQFGVKANGPTIARLANWVPYHFWDNPDECTRSFNRFEALARRLDDEGEPGSHQVRCQLANRYQLMPNPFEAARVLLTSVAGRPDRERADICLRLASRRLMTVGSPPRPALSDEQCQELENMLDLVAASLPWEMREEISNVPVWPQ